MHILSRKNAMLDFISCPQWDTNQHPLRSIVRLETNRASQELLNDYCCKWPLYIHVLPICLHKFETWSNEEEHFILYMQSIMLHVGKYLHRLQNTTKTLPDLVRGKLLNKRLLPKGRAFVNSRLAQSRERPTIDLKTVGSNPNMSKNVSCCIISRLPSRSWQLDWAHIDEIQHDMHR